MKKRELRTAVDTVKVDTKEALQTLFNELNQGQQKKVLKNAAIKEMFNRYGVEHTEQ